MSPFGWASLEDHDEPPPGISREQIELAILETVDLLQTQAEESAYRVALGTSPERYATNEVAINWNAALMYATGGLDALASGHVP